MVSLSQAKTMGGIGAILVFIPFVSLLGYILILIAVKDIADDLHDKSIFDNVVIAAVTGIVGALAGATVAVTLIGRLSGGFRFGGIIIGLLVAWIFLIVSAFYLRRAYDTMSTKLGTGSFRTAATLYFVGAILTIVIVGFLLLFIAQIMQAIAYFSIPDTVPSGASAASPALSPVATGATDGKFCPSCGSKIAASSTFCPICGAKQPGA